MGQRYWVVGGEYSDCRFKNLEPGTEKTTGSELLLRRADEEFRGVARIGSPLRPTHGASLSTRK